MSLIEHLEGPGWREFLARTFAATLDVLETDPYRLVGSSMDDLRAWLRVGGVSHARVRLGEQAILRRLSTEHQVQLIAAFDALVDQHRLQILRLAGGGVIPALSRASSLLGSPLSWTSPIVSRGWPPESDRSRTGCARPATARTTSRWCTRSSTAGSLVREVVGP